MLRTDGILETALYVEDMQRSADFYRELLAFETLEASEQLYALSVTEHQVLLLFKKGGSVKPMVTPFGTIPSTDGNGSLHLAFSISAAQLALWEKRFAEKGVPLESKVSWPEGGESLYFRDPDGHNIELKTSDWLGREFRW